MRTTPPISLLAGLMVVWAAGAGCSNDSSGNDGGARGGSGGVQADSGGMSTVPDGGGGLGSSGGPGGSGGANDASAQDGGGTGSDGADDRSPAGDAGPEVAEGGADASSSAGDAGPVVAGDGGMLSACPANSTRTDPPLTPAAFCADLLTPCMPHTQPPYKANCEAAYMAAKSQSCQSYNLCFGVVGMKMLIPYCSRAQGLGPAGNCS